MALVLKDRVKETTTTTGTGTYTFGKDSITDEGWEWVQTGDKYAGNFVEGKFNGIGQWTHAKNGKTERIETKMDAFVGWPDRD